MFNGKNHYKWWFSIVMLNYQRVSRTIRSWTTAMGIHKRASNRWTFQSAPSGEIQPAALMQETNQRNLEWFHGFWHFIPTNLYIYIYINILCKYLYIYIYIYRAYIILYIMNIFIYIIRDVNDVPSASLTELKSKHPILEMACAGSEMRTAQVKEKTTAKMCSLFVAGSPSPVCGLGRI